MQKILGFSQEGKQSLFAAFEQSDTSIDTKVAILPKKQAPSMALGEVKLPASPCCAVHTHVCKAHLATGD